MAKKLYPLFCDLEGRRIVIVGAGTVAARKAASLVSYGCRPVVYAPRACAAIEELADADSIELVLRAYRKGDLEGAFLVFSATGDPDTDDAVLAEARACGAIVNTVDDPARCDFYVPSSVVRGPFQIAISTSGASPTFAQRCRIELEQRYPEAYGPYVELLGAVRNLVKQRVPGTESVRKPLLAALLDAGLYERVASGEELDPEQVYSEVIGPLLEDGHGNASREGGDGR